eukprot:tig00000042_g15456.t1
MLTPARRNVNPAPAGLRPRTTADSLRRSRLEVTVDNALRKVSDRLFPDSKAIAPAPSSRRFHVANTDIASSLWLQMFLYYNVYYSCGWVILQGIMAAYKVETLNVGSMWGYVLPILIVAWAFLEASRLYLGYAGNLQEKVPQLAAHFLLTLLTQMPLTIFFINFQPRMAPIERAINILYAAFLLAELPLSYRAIKKLIRSQTAKFYLEDLTSGATPPRGQNADAPGFDSVF